MGSVLCGGRGIGFLAPALVATESLADLIARLRSPLDAIDAIPPL
jgi:hypothetical protein